MQDGGHGISIAKRSARVVYYPFVSYQDSEIESHLTEQLSGERSLGGPSLLLRGVLHPMLDASP